MSKSTYLLYLLNLNIIILCKEEKQETYLYFYPTLQLGKSQPLRSRLICGIFGKKLDNSEYFYGESRLFGLIDFQERLLVTHAVPFQYWPLEQVVDGESTHAVPFQY